MTDPIVSIVIPVYNAAKTIEAALTSVLTQTYPSLEIIVVDGLSTDDTQKILQQYSSKINHLISEKDHGVYDAMNKGIAVAKGEWIYLMGGDDQLAANDVVEKIMALVDPNTKLLFGKVENVNRAHRLVPAIHVSKFDGDICLRNTLHQQSVFYHRSLFHQRKFNPEYKILADYDFHLTLFEDKIEGHFADVLIAKCQAGGLSKNFTWALYREEIRMKRTHVKRQGKLFRLLYIPTVIAKFLRKKISG